MERLKETEALLAQCETDLKKLKKLQKEFKAIEANRKKLDNYYKNQYMADYNEFADSNVSYRILDQDSVWNVLNDQYYEKIKFIKSIIQTI